MAATNEDVVRYQKQVEELTKERQQDADRIATLEKDAKMSRYAMRLNDLAHEVVMDVAEELVDCQDLDEAHFDAHYAKCKKNYAKIPIGDRVRLADLDEGAVAKPAKGRINSKEDMDKVLKYQAEHPGCSPTEAREKALVG